MENQKQDNEKEQDTFLHTARQCLGKVPLLGALFDGRPKISVVRLSGIIAEHGVRKSGSFSHHRVSGHLDKAFRKADEAVILVINSPGGSPVQSGLIGSHIRRLAGEHDVPVYAFIEDVAASGGYWLACAADEIYAQDSSIVGSIGVISASFGFEEAIERYGIKRRVYTSGKQKSFLDPFLPENDEDVKRLKTIQSEMHDGFKDWVKSRRGDKLKGTAKTLFEGDFWTGVAALEKGLIDGIYDKDAFIAERFGNDVKQIDCTPEKPFLPMLLGGASARMTRAAPSALNADDILGTLESRAYWSRFGL